MQAIIQWSFAKLKVHDFTFLSMYEIKKIQVFETLLIIKCY